jgi:hypothetical protein
VPSSEVPGDWTQNCAELLPRAHERPFPTRDYGAQGYALCVASPCKSWPTPDEDSLSNLCVPGSHAGQPWHLTNAVDSAHRMQHPCIQYDTLLSITVFTAEFSKAASVVSRAGHALYLHTSMYARALALAAHHTNYPPQAKPGSTRCRNLTS